jgi:hypothetical protein
MTDFTSVLEGALLLGFIAGLVPAGVLGFVAGGQSATRRQRREAQHAVEALAVANDQPAPVGPEWTWWERRRWDRLARRLERAS